MKVAVIIVLVCAVAHMVRSAPANDGDFYQSDFESSDGRSRGSVKVSKDGRTVTSRSYSSVSGSSSSSVSVSSSSVSTSGGRAHGTSTVRTTVDGESHTYSAEANVGRDMDMGDFMEDAFVELRRREK
ncbi:hypothetical protein BSKO_02901 [Bryopsis sp. KO-2023]|nr:hypothetical protein BSKO_02901 [Bryopsis sp. KO-2023]